MENEKEEIWACCCPRCLAKRERLRQEEAEQQKPKRGFMCRGGKCFSCDSVPEGEAYHYKPRALGPTEVEVKAMLEDVDDLFKRLNWK